MTSGLRRRWAGLRALFRQADLAINKSSIEIALACQTSFEINDPWNVEVVIFNILYPKSGLLT